MSLFSDVRFIAEQDRFLRERESDRGLLRVHSIKRWSVIVFAASVPICAGLALDAISMRVFPMLLILCVVLSWPSHGKRLVQSNHVEALRMPSLAGLFVYRCWRLLPDVLWTSVCWVAGVVLAFDLSQREPQVGHWLLGIAVLLCPFYLLVGGALFDLLDRRPMQKILFGWFGLMLPCLVLPIVCTPLADVGARSLAAPNVAVLAGVIAVFAIGTPLFFVAAVRLMRSDHREILTVSQGVVVAAKEDDPKLQLAVDPSTVLLPDTHAGRRSLFSSLWFLKWQPIRRNLVASLRSPKLIIVLLSELLGLLFLFGFAAGLGVAVVLLAAPDAIDLYWPIIAVIVSPAVLNTEDGGLYLLGVDTRDLETVRRKAIVWFAMVPALGGGVITAILLGWHVGHLATLSVVAGLFVLRIGRLRLPVGWAVKSVLILAVLAWMVGATVTTEVAFVVAGAALVLGVINCRRTGLQAGAHGGLLAGALSRARST